MKGLWNTGPVVDQANAAITGGTISGVTGVATVVSAGGLPFIGLSTGSVAAGGAITGITALPAIYPDAYCYFPASKLATSGAGSAAGFYYCTFSSTTVGVAFLNQYVPGKATIPASPTAVTNGQGAFTGDTGEEFGLTLTIPTMTTTSAIRLGVSEQATNNANAKTVNVRFSGNGGFIMFAHSVASGVNFGFDGEIVNTGATNKQISVERGAQGTNPTSGVLGTTDTSLGTATLVFSLTRGVATDNLILLPPTVELVQ